MKIKKSAVLTTIIILALLSAGCSLSSTEQSQTQAESDMAATQTETAQPADALVSIKGIAVTENNVINPEGGYFITVPDSWIGKTSYALDGKLTIIHHITHDPDELEQNPSLLTAGSAAEGEETQGEVFMEIGSMKLFSIPRFDFPYSEGSKDALEFTELFDMVPQVLNTADLTDNIVPSDDFEADPCEDPNTEPAVSERGKPFTKDDAYVAVFKIGDAKEDVLAKVGQPQSTSEVVWEATGETRDINQFSFGQLVFSDGKLVVIQITDTSYEGPRGIKVGMALNDITKIFSSEIELDTDYMAILYRANPGGDEHTHVPPSAVLYKGDMQTLSFTEFTDAAGAQDMTAEELLENYRYMEQYDLLCQFDAQGVMLSFAVRIGTPSE